MTTGIVVDGNRGELPFDGDMYALEMVIALIHNEGCTDFVETGTFRGGTALGIKRACPSVTVWTVELDEQLFRDNNTRLQQAGINSYWGDSVSALKSIILPGVYSRPFFFLDSHVSAYNVSLNPSLKEYYPLKDELLAIAGVRHMRPIIAIHDFFNPHHPDYSYDKDHGVPLDWQYISGVIGKVYPQVSVESIPRFYNDRATGNNVGIIYIGVE